MSKKLFERFDGPQVTDSMIQEASQLNLQSLVSQLAVFVACVLKQLLGSRVRLSKERLRRDYLPDGLLCSYGLRLTEISLVMRSPAAGLPVAKRDVGLLS